MRGRRACASSMFQVLFNAAVTVGAGFAGLGHGAPVFADLFIGKTVDVGLAVCDELHRELVESLKVVRGILLPRPLDAQPLHVALGGVHVFDGLGLGVGVVKPQVALPAVVQRQAEVQADGLGVADVQVAVGFGREAGDDLRVAALPQVFIGGFL